MYKAAIYSIYNVVIKAVCWVEAAFFGNSSPFWRADIKKRRDNIEFFNTYFEKALTKLKAEDSVLPDLYLNFGVIFAGNSPCLSLKIMQPALF